MLIKLAYRSLLQRKTAAIMIILAISLSMSALLLTRSLSSELKNSFNSSVSGTDLIVGARSHPLQVLLYSVFRLPHYGSRSPSLGIAPSSFCLSPSLAQLIEHRKRREEASQGEQF